jgi:hypothetical protein
MRDQFGREVVLTDAAWSHIRQRRPGMAGYESRVQAAVATPDVVTWDAEYDDRENFYRRAPGRLYLKVCVTYDADGNGTVITAYLTRRVKRGEQRRWP